MKHRIIIATHNGRFHADDVFAVATIHLFMKKSNFVAWRKRQITSVRTRDEEEIKKADFVVDVGGKHDPANNRFDHHQEGGAETRANGIPYASFGLVWKKFGEHICGSALVAEMVDTKLVQSIDAHDNGYSIAKSLIKNAEPYLVEDFLFSFAPTWKESADAFDAHFSDMVAMALGLLEREIMHALAKEEAYMLVKESYMKAEDKRLVILDQFLPWKEVLVHFPEPLFVVYPATEEHTWHVKTVAAEKGRTFKSRKDFPKAWAGKKEEKLAKITGVPDAVFCHNKLFLAVARSKEGAIGLAKNALQS